MGCSTCGGASRLYPSIHTQPLTRPSAKDKDGNPIPASYVRKKPKPLQKKKPEDKNDNS